MDVTAYGLARRFVGLHETPGAVHNPAVLAMLKLVDGGVNDDETPWCSAFVHYIAWLLDLPRAKTLRARSWLNIGTPVDIYDARPGFDVVVLTRGTNPPPASVITAPGHVGFFAATLVQPARVTVLGGNQSDQVGFEDFSATRVLGVRRLRDLYDRAPTSLSR